MDGERAGVYVANGVDQAHHPPGAAQIEAGQRLAERGQVEEGVPGQDLLAARDEPVVQVTLLLRGGMQLVPDVRAAPGQAQPGQPQLGAEPLGERLECVELAGVVPRDDGRNLEPGETRGGEVAHRGQRRGV